MTTSRTAGTRRRLGRPSFDAGSIVAALSVDRRTLVVFGTGTGLVLLALLLRLVFLDRAYDVFTDEVTYLRLSEGIVGGGGLDLYGKPFLLHPPLFFLIEGPFTALTSTASEIDEVQAIRLLNVVLAAFTDAVLFALALRVAGLRAAVVVALLFAVDPFVIRLNSRNLLETSTMLWVLLGYLVLITADIEPGRHLSVRRSVAVGLLFGCAILTKEMAVFLTIVPMGALFLTRWAITRRRAVLILATAASVYALYPIAIAMAGLAPLWLEDKTAGLLRFVGVVKSTGFVASGGPSFTSAIVNNLDVFAMTYILIGLGAPACVVLLRDRRPRRRIVGVLCTCAYLLLGFSIAIGTLEEQFFYFLGVSAILAVPIAAESLLERWDGTRFAAARIAIPATGVLAIAVAWSLFTWTEIHLSPDDGYERVRAFLQRSASVGDTIGVTSEPQQFLLDGYDLQPIASSADIRRAHAQYVIVSTKQIQDGYTPNGARVYTWLQANATPAFVFDGRTYGRLEVYRIPRRFR